MNHQIFGFYDVNPCVPTCITSHNKLSHLRFFAAGALHKCVTSPWQVIFSVKRSRKCRLCIKTPKWLWLWYHRACVATLKLTCVFVFSSLELLQSLKWIMCSLPLPRIIVFLLCWSLWELASTINWGQTVSRWVSLVCSSPFVTVFCWSPCFFFPTPKPPPEALPGSGAGDITNSKQWLSVGANWPSAACFTSGPLACPRYRQGGRVKWVFYFQSALLRKCCLIVWY